MQAASEFAGKKEWAGLTVLALPTLLVSMDMSILYLATPSLSADLHPSSSELLWISDIYGFVLAGTLIPMGMLGDRIGRRTLLLIGALFFGLASMLCAYATNSTMLIVARALLGFAGATLLPSTLALIRNMFHSPQQRTFAIGVWTTCFTLGGVLGPIVGGFLLEHYWWGSVFLVGVPFMGALLLLGPIFLPEFREPSQGRFDLISVVQPMIALLALTYAIKQTASHGFGLITVVSLLVACIAGTLFGRRQRRLHQPLIDLSLLRNASFTAALGSLAFALFAWVGTSLLMAQYLQLVVGMSPMTAGFWTIPAAIGSVIGCLGAPSLALRLSPPQVVTAGLLLTAAGLAILAALSGEVGRAALVAGMVLLGLGVAMVVTLGTDLVLSAAPPDKAGAASAISETAAEVGGSFGVAVLGSVGIGAYRSAIAIPSGMTASDIHAARDTLGGAIDVAGGLQTDVGVQLQRSAQSAFTNGFELAMTTGFALVLAMAIGFAWITLLRRAQDRSFIREGEAQ